MSVITKTNRTALNETGKACAKSGTVLSIKGKSSIEAFEATTFLSRLRGLHAFLPLGAQQGLVISPCNAIHTMTMRSAIDVLFINRKGAVIKTQTVPPMRFIRCAGANAVLEMSEGSVTAMNIEIGDVLVKEHGTWE